MSIILTDEPLERALTKHARRQPVPTTKGRLLKSIAREVLAVAESEAIDVAVIINELRERVGTNTTTNEAA